MAVDLDDELRQLAAPAVCCLLCGTPFPDHGDAGGPVTIRAGGVIPVRCPGFRWVPADGPPVGSYADPPAR